MTWRIVLRLYGRAERIMEVRDVRALRAVLDSALSDPDVLSWRYWRLTELPPVRSVCTRCGTRYEPGKISGKVCRCGTMHIRYECPGCHTAETDPVYEEGCGSIPFDREGVNEKYRRQR